MTLVTVDQAADRLRVSARQVQRLARGGEIVQIGPNRVDWESVLRWQATRSGHERRAWAEATAWAAVALLAGVPVDWLVPSQRSRLRSQVRGVAPEEMVARTRNRAQVRRLVGHHSVIERVTAEVVSSGSGGRAAELTAVRSDQADGYTSAGQFDDLVRRHHLTSAEGDANVVLRTTDFNLKVVAAVAGSGPVLAGFDLAGSLDPRVRSTGLAIIRQAVGSLR